MMTYIKFTFSNQINHCVLQVVIFHTILHHPVFELPLLYFSIHILSRLLLTFITFVIQLAIPGRVQSPSDTWSTPLPVPRTLQSQLCCMSFKIHRTPFTSQSIEILDSICRRFSSYSIGASFLACSSSSRNSVMISFPVASYGKYSFFKRWYYA